MVRWLFNAVTGTGAALCVIYQATGSSSSRVLFCTVLSYAQVAVILKISASSAVKNDEEINDVFRKTHKYVDRFNSMTNKEKPHQELVDELDNLQEYVTGRSWLIDIIRTAYSRRPFSALSTFRKETDDGEELELHLSEVASLMNLVATDTSVEEAVALIPSLSRFPETAIEELLELIRSTMIRIVS